MIYLTELNIILKMLTEVKRTYEQSEKILQRENINNATNRSMTEMELKSTRTELKIHCRSSIAD
jgi:hypothetical protein